MLNLTNMEYFYEKVINAFEKNENKGQNYALLLPLKKRGAKAPRPAMLAEHVHIKNSQPLAAPDVLLRDLPCTTTSQNTVSYARQRINAILKRQDDKLVVVVGPCSIHDEQAAIEYAERLQKQIARFQQTLCLIMRVYFQKPRTTVGWKGLIHDPYLDESFDINYGLRLARRLLLTVNQLSIPTGSEFLDTITPHYISDLTSWSAIGARTVESQIHRQLASGLAMPVGFKNNQHGDIQTAINAVYAARHPQHFLSIAQNGAAAIISTSGNEFCHVILRGGYNGPNYDAGSIDIATKLLQAKQLPANIMVDCSHGNSDKDHRQQMIVVDQLAQQIANGNQNIIGAMLESHLIEGKQKLIQNVPLTYGQSITDACLGWEDTLQALELLSEAVIKRRQRKSL